MELDAKHLAGTGNTAMPSINSMVIPSHRVSHVNRISNQETKQKARTRGNWPMRRHYAFVPLAIFQDQCRLGLKELQTWRQSRAPEAYHNRARFGDQWCPGRGLPVA